MSRPFPRWRPILALSAVALLAACAGRDPAAIQVAQPGDNSRDCRAIAAETASNSQRIAELGGEKGAKAAQNIAAGVGGVFFFPLLFAMDFKGAAAADQKALEERNAHLAAIARERSC